MIFIIQKETKTMTTFRVTVYRKKEKLLAAIIRRENAEEAEEYARRTCASVNGDSWKVAMKAMETERE